MAWYKPNEPEKTEPSCFPVFVLDSPYGNVYGFPDFEGRGVKAAKHDHGRILKDGSEGRQDVTNEDVASVTQALAKFSRSSNARSGRHLSLHKHEGGRCPRLAGRRIHHRLPSRRSACDHRLALFWARLQVRERHRRNAVRDGSAGTAVRARVFPERFRPFV
jgi:hypothetical protein